MFRKFDKPIEFKDQVYDIKTDSYVEMKGMIVGILDNKYKVLNKFEPTNEKTKND